MRPWGLPCPILRITTRLWFDMSAALRALALEQQLPFVDLYDLGDGHADPFKRAFTENGIHPGPYGYARIAELISRVLSHEPWPWRLEINDSGVLEAASKGLQVWDFQSQAEGMAVTLKDDLLPAANADPKDALLPTSQALESFRSAACLPAVMP